MKTFPNKLIRFTSELDKADEDAMSLIKLKSVSLNHGGKIIKELSCNKEGMGWVAPYIFTKSSEAGDYQVQWNFTFNGESLAPQIDYITLQHKPDIHITHYDEPTKELEDKTLPIEMRGMFTDVSD